MLGNVEFAILTFYNRHALLKRNGLVGLFTFSAYWSPHCGNSQNRRSIYCLSFTLWSIVLRGQEKYLSSLQMWKKWWHWELSIHQASPLNDSSFHTVIMGGRSNSNPIQPLKVTRQGRGLLNKPFAFRRYRPRGELVSWYRFEKNYRLNQFWYNCFDSPLLFLCHVRAVEIMFYPLNTEQQEQMTTSIHLFHIILRNFCLIIMV